MSKNNQSVKQNNNNKEQNISEYISLAEGAEYSGYSQDYLRFRIRQGKLKAKKIARNWVTTCEWLDDYLKRVADYKNGIGKIKLAKAEPTEQKEQEDREENEALSQIEIIKNKGPIGDSEEPEIFDYKAEEPLKVQKEIEVVEELDEKPKNDLSPVEEIPANDFATSLNIKAGDSSVLGCDSQEQKLVFVPAEVPFLPWFRRFKAAGLAVLVILGAGVIGLAFGLSPLLVGKTFNLIASFEQSQKGPAIGKLWAEQTEKQLLTLGLILAKNEVEKLERLQEKLLSEGFLYSLPFEEPFQDNKIIELQGF